MKGENACELHGRRVGGLIDLGFKQTHDTGASSMIYKGTLPFQAVKIFPKIDYKKNGSRLHSIREVGGGRKGTEGGQGILKLFGKGDGTGHPRRSPKLSSIWLQKGTNPKSQMSLSLHGAAWALQGF